jgi:hypothetical protein
VEQHLLIDAMLSTIQQISQAAIELQQIVRDNRVDDRDDVKLAEFTRLRSAAVDRMTAVESALYSARRSGRPGRNGHGRL